jgi:hypothetical protein
MTDYILGGRCSLNSFRIGNKELCRREQKATNHFTLKEIEVAITTKIMPSVYEPFRSL